MTHCILLVVPLVATLSQIASPAAEILIGFANPLTGEMELAGEQMQNGVQLAVEELNAAGGVLGQKVVVNVIDDHCDAEQGAAAARKLVTDGIAVVIGHLCSGTAIPVSLIYEAAEIPLITLAANPLLTKRGLRFTFRSSPPDDANAEFTARYMVRQLAAKRIAIVHDTRVYGRGLAEMTRQSLVELGVQPVLFEAVQPGQLVFADLIERLRDAEIDVVYYGGYPREVGLLRRQMAEAAFVPPLIASGANSSEEFELIAGQAAEGTLVVADRRFDTAEFARFEADLRAACGMDSDLRVTRGYAGAKIWAQAVATAGTTDGGAVAEALRSGTFHVFGSEARFDDAGNMQGPLGEPALFGSGTSAGPCHCQRILPPSQSHPPAPAPPTARATEASAGPCCRRSARFERSDAGPRWGERGSGSSSEPAVACSRARGRPPVEGAAVPRGDHWPRGAIRLTWRKEGGSGFDQVRSAPPGRPARRANSRGGAERGWTCQPE